MARHKNISWNLPEGIPQNIDGGAKHFWPSIHAALLMDIRDELKAIRRNTCKPGKKKAA